MAEGWNIAEQAHPDLAWLIRAEDAGGRRILVGQNKARADLIHLEARVNVADEHRGTFGVRLELPNPDYKLPPGLKCKVHFLKP